MKASIEIKEHKDFQPGTKGWFSKGVPYTIYRVLCQLEFTQEEKDILTKYNLWDTPVYTSRVSAKYLQQMGAQVQGLFEAGEAMPFTIKDLALFNETSGFNGGDIIEAKIIAKALEEDVLPLIKQYLTVSVVPTEKKTLEF